MWACIACRFSTDKPPECTGSGKRLEPNIIARCCDAVQHGRGRPRLHPTVILEARTSPPVLLLTSWPALLEAQLFRTEVCLPAKWMLRLQSALIQRSRFPPLFLRLQTSRNI